jgi:ferredoxin
VDLLRLPAARVLLRSRHIRLAAQIVSLAVAFFVVLHGLFGPQIAPRNLATVLTSIHWRGLLVVGILAIGNVFCTACPLVLARDAGRRVFHAGRPWPKQLRGKWVGLVLLALILYSYELFDVWELPRATASIVVGYFVLALVVDLTFKGASFCKHVCPIGQFNFIASAISPTEVRVRDTAVCRRCHTFDCIKGHYASSQPIRLIQRGCELGLFLPAKVGNLDCTLCLDCVQACPHDNIGLMTRVPAAELLETRRRSGIGRLAERTDIAALAVVFTFAGLINAFAMTSASIALERTLAGVLGVRSEAPVLGVMFLTGLLIFPALLMGAAATASRALAGVPTTVTATAVRYAYTIVPLGFGVWLAHYGFHLLTGVLTIVPVAQSAAIDAAGWGVLGEPAWRWTGMQPGAVHPIQLGVTLLGVIGSVGLVNATSQRDSPQRAIGASIPWLSLILVLAIAALWILTLPMEMRGTSGVG